MAKIVLVAAVARNGAIGVKGGLPWRIPSDLKHLRATTWGRPMIMGRKTFDSIGKPLPGRESIVVTRAAASKRKYRSFERYPSSSSHAPSIVT